MSATKINNKKMIITLTLVLLLLAVVSAATYIIVLNSRSKTSQVVTDQDAAKTTSTAQTAQEDFTEGTDREPGNSLNENEGSGTVTDNQGSVDSTGNELEWITSQTGEITVYSPVANSTLKSGDKISGQSTLSKISFRIIDNVSGVIGEGQLVVKSGRFSGSLDFTTSASEGRIDIFAVEQDGREYSNIEIPVRLR